MTNLSELRTVLNSRKWKRMQDIPVYIFRKGKAYRINKSIMFSESEHEAMLLLSEGEPVPSNHPWMSKQSLDRMITAPEGTIALIHDSFVKEYRPKKK
jgi:hypothetical protein